MIQIVIRCVSCLLINSVFHTYNLVLCISVKFMFD